MIRRGIGLDIRSGPAWRLLRALAGAGLASLVAFTIGVALFARSLDRREVADIAAADGIVVLTGGADRISDALALLERFKGRRLLITGVHVSSPAEVLKRRHPGREALFDCCVDLDFQARNTYENAAETQRWVADNGFTSIVLVTASYHLPRAMVEFEAMMPAITVHAYPVVPDASRLRRWWQDPALVRLIALEFVKYWAASLRVSLGIPGR
jgi:uncharacterized SAM-binding protein YcdF (DUF218 family)